MVYSQELTRIVAKSIWTLENMGYDEIGLCVQNIDIT